MEPSIISDRLNEWTEFFWDLGPLKLVILLTPAIWVLLLFIPLKILRPHTAWLSMVMPALIFCWAGERNPVIAPQYSSPTACYAGMGLLIGITATVLRIIFLPKKWHNKITSAAERATGIPFIREKMTNGE